MALTSTVLTFMEEDHDRLDGLFEEFRTIKNNDKNKAKKWFHEFKIGLQRHIVWEDEILFPIFEQRTGMRDRGPTAVMRMEHRQIKEFLEQIHDGLMADSDTTKAEEGLLQVLAAHNEKEENVLYPWIDQSVDEKEREELFIHMQQMPPEKYNTCCE